MVETAIGLHMQPAAKAALTIPVPAAAVVAAAEASEKVAPAAMAA
jgi:hypothetical protein